MRSQFRAKAARDNPRGETSSGVRRIRSIPRSRPKIHSESVRPAIAPATPAQNVPVTTRRPPAANGASRMSDTPSRMAMSCAVRHHRGQARRDRCQLGPVQPTMQRGRPCPRRLRTRRRARDTTGAMSATASPAQALRLGDCAWRSALPFSRPSRNLIFRGMDRLIRIKHGTCLRRVPLSGVNSSR